MLVLEKVAYKFTKDMEPAGYAKDGDIITFVTKNALGDQFKNS